MASASRTLWERWLEPGLALFGLVLVAGTGLNKTTLSNSFWVGNAAPFLSAAFASRYVRSSACVTAALTVAMLWLPTNEIGVGAVAVLIHVFAVVRLRRPHANLMAAGGMILSFVVIVSFATRESVFADIVLALVLDALAVSGALTWRAVEKRIVLTQELGHQRLISYRMELARDLHDTVAQTLAHAAMRANVMMMMSPDLPEDVRKELELISAECNASAHDLRILLSSLRDQGIQTGSNGPAGAQTLKDDVAVEVERLEKAGFRVDSTLRLTSATPARAITLSRLTHEAANNMIKHAPPGSRVGISIREEDGSLIAEYSNPDTGKKQNKNRFGLVGMRERASQFHGTFVLDRSDGQWRVIVTLPQPSLTLPEE